MRWLNDLEKSKCHSSTTPRKLARGLNPPGADTFGEDFGCASSFRVYTPDHRHRPQISLIHEPHQGLTAAHRMPRLASRLPGPARSVSPCALAAGTLRLLPIVSYLPRSWGQLRTARADAEGHFPAVAGDLDRLALAVSVGCAGQRGPVFRWGPFGFVDQRLRVWYTKGQWT